MENQIKLYHDLTAFWLYKEWKTPREKQLEKQVDKLKQEISTLKAQLPQYYKKGYQESKEKYLVTYHCRGCGQLMEIDHENEKKAAREYMEYHRWGHSGC